MLAEQLEQRHNNFFRIEWDEKEGEIDCLKNKDEKLGAK